VAPSPTRQLLDDVARARQLAISQRTDVYMIFVPTNFWTDPAWNTNAWPLRARQTAEDLYGKQLVGYAFVSLRSVGDQPGSNIPHYLSNWKTLPEGAFIPWAKWAPNNQVMNLYTNNPANGASMLALQVAGFNKTASIPFPTADTPATGPAKRPYITLPYIAFDYLGRLTDDKHNIQPQNALIPLAKGSAGFAHDQVSKIPIQALPTLTESPPGNSTNSFVVVNIDWLTGRARVEHVEVQ
jgi:hypothetical protein